MELESEIGFSQESGDLAENVNDYYRVVLKCDVTLWTPLR
jgi:hypothetical protein